MTLVPGDLLSLGGFAPPVSAQPDTTITVKYDQVATVEVRVLHRRNVTRSLPSRADASPNSRESCAAQAE